MADELNKFGDIKSKLKSMTPEQTEIFNEFKKVVTADSNEKGKVFAEFLGYLNRRKQGGVQNV